MAGGSSSKPIGRLRLEGGPALRRRLKTAEGKLEDLTALHKRVAELVAGRAEETAPVGPPTVHVRSTIRAAGTKAAAIVRAGRGRRIGYAMSVHWGRKITTKAGQTVVVKAQPWVTQAAQDLQPRWTDLYVSELSKIIDSVEGPATP